jgi:sugar phosphate isomerase/epimerase
MWDDRNASEEVYQETLAVVKDIVACAAQNGVTFLIENYVNNVIGSVKQIKRLFADVDSEHLGLLCDPTNYFDESNIDRVDATLHEIFDELAPLMKVAHAKDCKRAEDTSEKHADIDADESHTFRGAGGVELPAAGLGVLNYPLYLTLLAKHHPNMPIIIEHLDEGDIPRAKGFVDGALKKAGV